MSVAVLVVATPCPLILAVPVALVSGLSRAAKLGILVKSGRALEMLAQRPRPGHRQDRHADDRAGLLVECAHRPTAPAPTEVLRLAASLDQASKRIIARDPRGGGAREQGLPLSVPSNVVETPGEGIAGLVDGRAVAVGGFHYVASKMGDVAHPLPESRPAAGRAGVSGGGRRQADRGA